MAFLQLFAFTLFIFAPLAIAKLQQPNLVFILADDFVLEPSFISKRIF